ncbi:hypothetical protein Ciccas_002844 [Cichlidogyrus casuarinus]|uniref:Immunoglobulin domain-containing protein n=1 Tax=Cichlidogyrus casuarinus TaxID=1844966 RepID=A0ABD2QG27_9PLAT
MKLLVLCVLYFMLVRGEKRPPQEVRMPRGATVTLPCKDASASSVQWLVDDFGYDANSIRISFKDRYFMPGPMEQGVFDLEIRNLTLTDSVSFACQIAQRPASVFYDLVVLVPPKQLSMQQFNLAQLPYQADFIKEFQGQFPSINQ